MNRTTLEVVTRQVEAMGVDFFEIGLYKPLAGGAGNEPEMLPRTWDQATLLRSVGWLKYQNSQGRNIYIRPKGEHPLSLVDDLTGTAVERMRQEGFQPSVIVETSPDNFQAWLNHGQILPKAESTGAARALAERFGGDKGAADWRHFGRLAGLTNRKERHRALDGQYPFVRLISASSGLVYEARDTFVAHVRAMLERRRHPSVRAANPPSNHTAGRRLLTIDDFRARPEYGGDGNRIDLAYAVYALSHFVPDSELRAAISSRDLSKKGSEARQADYIERTIRKALAATDQKGVARLREPSLTVGRTR